MCLLISVNLDTTWDFDIFRQNVSKDFRYLMLPIHKNVIKQTSPQMAAKDKNTKTDKILKGRMLGYWISYFPQNSV